MQLLCVDEMDNCCAPLFAAILQQKLMVSGARGFEHEIRSAGWSPKAEGGGPMAFLFQLRWKWGIKKAPDLSTHRGHFIGNLRQDVDGIICMDGTSFDMVVDSKPASATGIQLVNQPQDIVVPTSEKPEDYVAFYGTLCAVAEDMMVRIPRSR